VKPELFRLDLEAKPETLAVLADALAAADPWSGVLAAVPAPRRVVFLGMGSSRYAAGAAAARLRAAGVDAVAEYASATTSYPPAQDTLVVAISATGTSRETLRALDRYTGRATVAALTNDVDSAITKRANLLVNMLAGPERSGIACRTYQHTLALLLDLESKLTGGAPAHHLLRKAVAACSDLLQRRPEWLPAAAGLLDGPNGVYILAPAERLSSAEQSALMVREGPRRPAGACETGDWAHVDVYLAKTLDYRALLYAGSDYDDQAVAWLRQRGSTLVAVGPASAAATRYAKLHIRYPDDDDPAIALLTETLVAELIADAWQTRSTTLVLRVERLDVVGVGAGDGGALDLQ
jgi:glucosamine--fructose-6-phosphate aminotransferase (isomerizing)